VKVLGWIFLALVVSVVVVSCGAVDGPAESAAPAAEAVQEDEPPARCESVSEEVVAALASGLTVQGGGTLRDAWAVRSNDFENVYFVAAEIDGPGIEGDGDIGVWTASDPSSPGGHYSVNAVAKEFSDWGDGGATTAGFSLADDGVSESRDCVRDS